MLESSTPIRPNVGNKNNGYGRMCTLKNKISIEEAVQLVKKCTGLKHIRLARTHLTGINFLLISKLVCKFDILQFHFIFQMVRLKLSHFVLGLEHPF